jgi:DNA polymerase-3 subunit beta
MKFVVSSTVLLSHLQAISRVINSKNSLPILDNFLLNLEEKNVDNDGFRHRNYTYHFARGG